MTDSDNPIYERYKGLLVGAEMGKVVTRFPPEPSGYLHIGHLKAALLNYHYAKMYKGKMLLRFDDTNPSNESADFVDNIKKDLQVLKIIPDSVSFTSDYIEKFQEEMIKMIEKGLAYADDTLQELMSEQRRAMIPSKNREISVAESLKYFKEIVKGSEEGVKWCIRAKIDYQCVTNSVMRDPVFFRCNLTPHHRQGTKYKAYPTYDFACPLIDSWEGVTHALRSNEYALRNELYTWVIKATEVRNVEI